MTRRTRSDKNTRRTLRLKPRTDDNIRVIALRCEISVNETINRMLNQLINDQQALKKFFEAHAPAQDAPRVIYVEGEI